MFHEGLWGSVVVDDGDTLQLETVQDGHVHFDHGLVFPQRDGCAGVQAHFQGDGLQENTHKGNHEL